MKKFCLNITITVVIAFAALAIPQAEAIMSRGVYVNGKVHYLGFGTGNFQQSIYHKEKAVDPTTSWIWPEPSDNDATNSSWITIGACNPDPAHRSVMNGAIFAYLRANGFKTCIASGGGVEFMRPWTEKVYGVPPEQVIGSSFKTKFELRNGNPVLVLLPGFNFIDEKEGKPLGINQYIGRRPIAAFGNSDGDLQMLQWTTAGSGARFALLVHHTDAEREWA
jgi:hypothetical protein